MKEKHLLLKLVESLNVMIYDRSVPTPYDFFVYEPINKGKDCVHFSNSVVKFDIKSNKILNIEKICRYIYCNDNNKIIKVRYIPQDDGGVIKYIDNYDLLKKERSYTICNILSNKKESFFIDELGYITKISTDAKSNSNFYSVLENEITKNITEELISFKVDKSGKIDIDSIFGFNEDNTNLIEKIKVLENLSKSEDDWRVGRFAVATGDLYIALFANAFCDDKTIDKNYLKRLRLINWKEDIKFNSKYLLRFNEDEFKEDLGIEKNCIIPLTYKKHVSLLLTDGSNNLHQFDTSNLESGRKELSNIGNLCKIKQRGQCCGYSILNFILRNKNNNIENIKQNDEIINKKMLEYDGTGNPNMTEYLIEIIENIKILKENENSKININIIKYIYYRTHYILEQYLDSESYSIIKDDGSGGEKGKEIILDFSGNEDLKELEKKVKETKDKRKDMVGGTLTDKIKKEIKDNLLNIPEKYGIISYEKLPKKGKNYTILRKEKLGQQYLYI